VAPHQQRRQLEQLDCQRIAVLRCVRAAHG
jgi:hypothetical protein